MRNVGSGKFVYEEVKEWAQYPDGWTTEDAPAVAVDSQDRVYALIRNKTGLLRFDHDGRFQTCWEEERFELPHGLFIAADDSVYVVDAWGHSVFKFTPDGEQLMLIETKDNPSDTGYVRSKKPVVRGGPPFNEPTGCVLSPEGELYVTDGYGNARVHKFSADGELLFSWGEPGGGPGQFNPPHGAFVDENGLLYVSDRMNRCVQIFNPGGEYVNEWDGNYPNNMCGDAEGNRYVAEMGGVRLYGRELKFDKFPARITVRDADGVVLSEWGEDDPTGAGQYFCPHGIAVDSRGDLYVSEVATSYNFGAAPQGWGVIRKYVRR